MARQLLWDLRDFLKKPKAKPKQRKMQPAGTIITASPRQHKGMNSWAVLALEVIHSASRVKCACFEHVVQVELHLQGCAAQGLCFLSFRCVSMLQLLPHAATLLVSWKWLCLTASSNQLSASVFALHHGLLTLTCPALPCLLHC